MTSDLESRVRALELSVMQVQIQQAVSKEQYETLLERMNSIGNNVSWLVKLIVGALVMAIIGFVVQGGLEIKKAAAAETATALYGYTLSYQPLQVEQ